MKNSHLKESKEKRSAIKESLTFEDTIRTRIHIESEEDLEDTPFEYYLDADIGDTVYICEDADVYMREDKNGWVIFWHNKFMEHIPLSLLDRDDEEACNAKYRQAQKRYKAICNAALDGTLEKEFSGNKNRKPSFDYSNASEVFKQFGESYNKSQLFDKILNESTLKENGRSLEWLLDKAYVSEYRMVGKNSAEVRVRHTPELLTSDSMAARFEEDIPDGYKLEVDYLGEDPILGRNFDIYEVQLLREGTNNKMLNEGKFKDKVIPTLIGIGATAGIAAPLTGLAIHQNKSFDRLVDNLGLELSEKANQPDGASCFVNAIKDFKYDGKISKEYGMDIDGLCDYLYDYSQQHFSVTGDGLDISYEDCGDYYLISYEGEYIISIGNPNSRSKKICHAEDSFKISKDYFGTQFILDEATVAQAKRFGENTMKNKLFKNI